MLLVFDYDGTLHDTAKLYGNAFREAYADLVRDHYAPDRYYSDSDMARYLGLSPPDMWHTFMPDLPEEVWKKASLKVREGMITGIENGKAVLYAGATDMLDKLNLDVDEIINAKMDINEKKYPVEKAKGTAEKYDKL